MKEMNQIAEVTFPSILFLCKKERNVFIWPSEKFKLLKIIIH